MHGEPLAPLHPRLRRQARHRLEGSDVLRPAVRVARVVQRIHPDVEIGGTQHLRPGEGEGEEDGVAGRHVGDRDPLPHLPGAAPLRHREVGGQGRAPDGAQIDVHHHVPGHPLGLRHPPGGVQLYRVALAVTEAHGVGGEPLGLRHRERGRRVEAAGEQHDRPPEPAHGALPSRPGAVPQRFRLPLLPSASAPVPARHWPPGRFPATP